MSKEILPSEKNRVIAEWIEPEVYNWLDIGNDYEQSSLGAWVRRKMSIKEPREFQYHTIASLLALFFLPNGTRLEKYKDLWTIYVPNLNVMQALDFKPNGLCIVIQEAAYQQALKVKNDD